MSKFRSDRDVNSSCRTARSRNGYAFSARTGTMRATDFVTNVDSYDRCLAICLCPRARAKALARAMAPAKDNLIHESAMSEEECAYILSAVS
eukprot:4907243-Amphidinium_carterae.1